MTIKLMTAESVTITRYAEGTYKNGYYVPGASSTISILCSVQPMPGEEILQLSEGDRKRQTLWFFSETEINSGDILTRVIDNKRYEVLKTEKWPSQGLIHYLATGALIED